MCGIFGLINEGIAPIDPALVSAAHAVQGHRGPDGRGSETFEFCDRTLLLGHQRLAIIDLTEAGHQPMRYRDGKGSIVYNGELYNYLELREELRREGETFSTHSDTEVLLAALHRWGPAKALSKFNWMGAFAWIDLRQECLTIARDAGSEKPLYYTWGAGGKFAFASEIKTLLTIVGGRFSLNRDVVGRFLHQGLTDTSTQTFFEGIQQLEASSYAQLNFADSTRNLSCHRYSPPGYDGNAESLSLQECIEEVRRLFIDSVCVRLRSDVPVGVLLSGGIDSSSIAAAAQRLRGNAGGPQLLSFVSNDPLFDESQHIAAMERHLKQDAAKISLHVAPDTLVQDISDVNWINDEPVSGLSALGHYRLMEYAKQRGVTVILSGQGADETFLGYRKYLGFYLQSLMRNGRHLQAAKVLAGFVANRTIVNQLALADAKRYVPLLRKLGARSKDNAENLDGEWLSGWHPALVGLGSGSLAMRQREDIEHLSVPSLCHYEDRMSMAMSREIRLPFLDSRLIDLMLRVPDDYKLRKGWTKYCLRVAMRSFLPEQITWRKDKKGFSNPQGEWLKHVLQASVTDAFGRDGILAQAGIMRSAPLLRKYRRYCGQPPGRGAIWYREIFAPFSLELWMRRYSQWLA